MSKYNVLELFAGCGGLGYGFESNNKFNILCANELEEEIAKTYKYNYPNTNCIVGDITNSNIKNEIYNNFLENNCDIILGGPPCVAYSMSGNRNSRDPRGLLFNDYVEIVNKLKPKLFIMENVKGILTMYHDKDNLNNEEKILADKFYKLEKEKLELEKNNKNLNIEKRKQDNNKDNNYNLKNHKKIKKDIKDIKKKIKDIDISPFRIKVEDKIKNKFQSIGYNIESKLLNSANFGVPQKRERVIFIGVRNDINKKIIYPIETHNEKGIDNKKKWKSVKESIDDLKDIEQNKDFSQIYTNHSKDMIKKIENTSLGKSVNPKYTEACFRCFPDKPSNTVKENHGGVFIHYEKNRVMTPRELARLQSFPDKFIFKGSKASILKQLGNAVPVGLSEALANNVINILD